MKVRLIATVMLLAISACTAQPKIEHVVVREEVEVVENKVPGTVNNAWVEPMYDTVRVPSQLDPSETYYRPSHRTVVEIRPGRYQEVQYPEDR